MNEELLVTLLILMFVMLFFAVAGWAADRWADHERRYGPSRLARAFDKWENPWNN